MSRMLVRELLWKASSMLQDVKPQFKVHPERDMVSWANDAQLAIIKYLPAACSRMDAVRLKPGTKQSIEELPTADVKREGGAPPLQPVRGMQLLGLVRNMGADGVTPGRAIPPAVDRKLLDRQSPNWHSSVGTFVRQFTFDPMTPRHFFVEPGVPAGRLWVDLSYIAEPDQIPAGGEKGAELYRLDGANDTEISLSNENADDLVNYICARAYLKRADAAAEDGRAGQYVSLFTASINARVAALTGTNPNLKRLPFAPQPVGSAS
ncbi:hypothetical protein OU995_21255 [Roseateles sp. SL47]|uniref:phage adaptor protein n=1 Tax=Roseateles sp. SL47 TaxID=2995138 RepID=UPI002271D1EF|nr:DUF6682 family protein [Roseateles sp. SL47]WAC72074.1 hypothetical protein OU995_21255 [Roseateles sp. SL47]